MKRLSIEARQVAERSNLLLALSKVVAGKRQRPYVRRYLAELDSNLNQLSRDILASQLPYGEFRSFTIHDPKQRQIHAACLADRVFHHALMNVAGPVFERGQTDVSYACRPGRGNHAAALRVQQLLRGRAWFVKIDVEHYFNAIRHDVLMGLLARRFKGEWLLATFRRIVDAWALQPRIGLPIGTLTSQYFANHYLDGLDRLLTEKLQLGPAVRYMDDVIWFADTKAEARHSLDCVSEYLQLHRGLRIKPSWQINRCQHGVLYCGHSITPQQIRLSQRRRRRYRHLRLAAEQEYLNGRISALQLQQRMAAVHSITLPADADSWRREHLRRVGSIDV